MFAILFSQLAGLVRGILVARAFGASPQLDAFFAANRVSETLFLLIAGGALGSAPPDVCRIARALKRLSLELPSR